MKKKKSLIKKILIGLGIAIGANIALAAYLILFGENHYAPVDMDGEYEAFLQIFDFKNKPGLKEEFINHFMDESWDPFKAYENL